MPVHERIRDESFKDVERLVNKLAWKATKSHPRCDFDDLQSVAFEGYALAYATYDSSRAEFTTHVWWCVTHTLKNYCTAFVRAYSKHAYDSEAIEYAPDVRSNFSQRVAELSDNAQAIVKLIVEAPEEVLPMIGGSDTKGMLRCYLSGLGWPMSVVTESFSEITELFRS